MSFPLYKRGAPNGRDIPALRPLTTIVPNPGALTGQLYRPDGLHDDAPLVVVLHGCTQGGPDYASDAGWLGLAEQHGFAVLVPVQQRSNNANLCFNWFEPGDVMREQGEVASIKAMIDQSILECRSDPARIYVTGLSAGAAMAGALLAAYPEVFAGGGLVAGLPHGVADSMVSAMQRMRTAGRDGSEALADHVRNASNHSGPWPRVSIWHGTTDRTVSVENGKAIVRQWLAVHGLVANTPVTREAQGWRRQQWTDSAGVVCVEYIEVSGMGHGTPIDARNVAETAAPYILDVGMSSSCALIEFWQIGVSERVTSDHVPTVASITLSSGLPASQAAAQQASAVKAESGVEKIINDALRKAGLLPQL